MPKQKEENPANTFGKLFEKLATKEEVAQAISQLLSVVKEFENMALTKAQTDRTAMSQEVQQALAALQETKTLLETAVQEDVFRSELRTLTRLLQQEVDRLESQIPEAYDDSALRGEITAVREALPPPFDPSALHNDITSLREQIQKLEEELKKPRGTVGGVTNLRIAQAFKYIAHTEEPVGAINGSNTAYTVKNPIWWIAGFTLNGEEIAELPNFTYAGRTITFASALPAAYSGKDFEVKYIGI